MASPNSWIRIFVFVHIAFASIWASQVQADTVDLRCHGTQTDLNPITYRGAASSQTRISFAVSIGNNYLVIENGGNSVSLPITALTEDAVVSNAVTAELAYPSAKTITRFEWLVNISRIHGSIRVFKSLEGTDSVWLAIEGRCQSGRLF